jgi:hypothetical protein
MKSPALAAGSTALHNPRYTNHTQPHPHPVQPDGEERLLSV